MSCPTFSRVTGAFKREDGQIIFAFLLFINSNSFLMHIVLLAIISRFFTVKHEFANKLKSIQ